MEEDRNALKILTGTPTGKRPLGKPRHRWEDNIRMDRKEIQLNRDSPTLRDRRGVGLPKVGSTYVHILFNLHCISLEI